MCLSGHRKYPLGDLDPDTESRSLEIMEKAIYLAQDLGIRIIQLAGYDVYYKEGNKDTKNQFVKNLHIATEMAAKYGIVMGFETMETPFMDTVEKAILANATTAAGNTLILSIVHTYKYILILAI